MAEYLPSWKDTPTRQAILDFVAKVTDPNSAGYVPPEERIATFDNDGTLWCEHPVPVQVMAVLDGLTRAVQQNPALGEQPLYRAAAERNMAWFAPYMSNERIPELIGMMLAAGAGETQAEFEARAAAWLALVTYALAAVLLISIGFTPWVMLVFPAWVFVISVYILVLNYRVQQGDEQQKDGLTVDE